MFWIAFLSGTTIRRMLGTEATKFAGWQRLNAEYANEFCVETPTGRLWRLKTRESRWMKRARQHRRAVCA
jgi:hypothetical protein